KDAYLFRTARRPYEACGVNGVQFDVEYSPCRQVMLARGWTLDRVHNLSDVARFRGFRQEKPALFDFTRIFRLFGLIPRPAPAPPPQPSEQDIWYAIHRRALRRGFRAERQRGLVQAGRHSFREYCR